MSELDKQTLITPLQVEVLLAAGDKPRSLYAMLGCGGIDKSRRKRIDDLVKAGFISLEKDGKSKKYAITPQGRQLSEMLLRLEAVQYG